MSTRSNILLIQEGDESRELWFYRHSGGYPEGAMPLIARFVKNVNAGNIRANLMQASGWLIAFGVEEFNANDRPEYCNLVDGKFVPTGEPSGWKIGVIEPTTSQHIDIVYLYTITLTGNWLRGGAEVKCQEISGGWRGDPKGYKIVDVSEYLTEGALTKA